MKAYECSFCHDVNAWVAKHTVDYSSRHGLPEGYLIETVYVCGVMSCIHAAALWEVQLTSPQLFSKGPEWERMVIPAFFTVIWLMLVLNLR